MGDLSGEGVLSELYGNSQWYRMPVNSEAVGRVMSNSEESGRVAQATARSKEYDCYLFEVHTWFFGLFPSLLVLPDSCQLKIGTPCVWRTGSHAPGMSSSRAATAATSMAASPEKWQKYQDKDLETKVEILKVLKDGVFQQLMERYDVKRSTLATYVKNEAEILRAFESKFKTKRKQLQKTAHPKLEEPLLRWVVSAWDAQLPSSGPLIRK